MISPSQPSSRLNELVSPLAVLQQANDRRFQHQVPSSVTPSRVVRSVVARPLDVAGSHNHGSKDVAQTVLLDYPERIGVRRIPYRVRHYQVQNSLFHSVSQHLSSLRYTQRCYPRSNWIPYPLTESNYLDFHWIQRSPP